MTRASRPIAEPSAADQSESLPLIRTRNLTRVFQVGNTDVPALRGVTFDVARGEFVVLSGVSGSGKSTLLHLVGALDRPDSGDIYVAGQNLADMTAHAATHYRRSTVGIIFQSFYLLPHLTALANVATALGFQGIWGTEQRRRARQILTEVGLGDRLRHRPSQLSGGQQQRVALARALVHRPALLLADEPTANLDQATSRDLLTMIRDLQRQHGTTVLMASHDEDLARRFCDRMVHLCDGQLID